MIIQMLWKPEYLYSVLDMCLLINQCIKLELVLFNVIIDMRTKTRQESVYKALSNVLSH